MMSWLGCYLLLSTPDDSADGMRNSVFRQSAVKLALDASGQISFADDLQMWFRYYLQQHIESSMSEIETKQGIYSLDFHRQAENSGDDGRSANALGAVGNQDGKWWTAADIPGTRKVQHAGPVGI